jgi:hypothetical protein
MRGAGAAGSVVVDVAHDHATDEAGRHPPRRVPGVLLLTCHTLELEVELLGEVLTQEVRRARLESLLVLHHGLARVAPHRAGELLRLGLEPRDRRHRDPVLHELPIQSQDEERLCLGLLGRGMRGVPLLPQEFGRAQEESGAQLPSHHVCPLIDQDG